MHKTFEKSRVLEYFKEKELGIQMGSAGLDKWPIMLIKELIDNAIDACESADVAPEIAIEVGEDYFSIADNGPGIPFGTVAKSLDYSVRVSSNDAYIRPTRGQLGNALKLVWAAPYVATGQGRVTVIGGGHHHQITVTAEPLTGHPNLEHRHRETKTQGTFVKIGWIGLTCAASCNDEPKLTIFTLWELCRKYSFLNPHLTITVKGLWEFGFDATDTNWKAWRASQPGSVWWYSFKQFCDLIRRYLVSDRQSGKDTTLREFLTVFDGFKSSGKQKKITDACGLKGAMLKDLMAGNDLDEVEAHALFSEMRAMAKPVTPQRLGAIEKPWDDGEYACQKTLIKTFSKELPCVVEVAFRVGEGRDLFCYGLNNAVIFEAPSSEITGMMADNCLVNDRAEGVAIEFLLHIRCPEFIFSEMGKQRMVIPSPMAEAIKKAMGKACKKWKREMGRLKRNREITQKEAQRYDQSLKPKTVNVKTAAYEVMEQAYLQASDGGRLPANARQIMYAARPHILERTGKNDFDYGNFAGKIVPAFLEDYPELTASWKVAYDPRGNFIEPDGVPVPLGTLAVESYLGQWRSPEVTVNTEASLTVQTNGPMGNYHAALFVEKEGFNHLLNESRIAQKYDIAIMSTKGMPSTSARALLEELTRKQVPIFVLHDFDKKGFEILRTLKTDTARYQFEVEPIVYDLGLRLDDVERLGLQSEPVTHNEKETDPSIGLRESGCTEAEVNFLVEPPEYYWKEGKQKKRWHGQRVELNALTSQQFLDIIEDGLRTHGIGKLIPDDALLNEVYRQNVKTDKINEVLQQALKHLDFDDSYIPPDELRGMVESKLRENPTLSWADAVRSL